MLERSSSGAQEGRDGGKWGVGGHPAENENTNRKFTLKTQIKCTHDCSLAMIRSPLSSEYWRFRSTTDLSDMGEQVTRGGIYHVELNYPRAGGNVIIADYNKNKHCISNIAFLGN